MSSNKDTGGEETTYKCRNSNCTGVILHRRLCHRGICQQKQQRRARYNAKMILVNIHAMPRSSTHIRKNGHRKGKQNSYLQIVNGSLLMTTDPSQGYSDEKKRMLKMYVNGMGMWASNESAGHKTTGDIGQSGGELLLDAL